MVSLKITGMGKDHAEIMVLVNMELDSAIKKHPFWPECNIKRSAIVNEEAGELVREANLLDEGKGSIQGLKTECIQTAAMAIRMLIHLYQDEIPKDVTNKPQRFNHLTKEYINSTLIKNVTHLRKSMGFSQNEFANRYNISRSSVGSYEEGRANPSYLLLIRLSEDIEIDIKTILTEDLTRR